MLIVRTHFSYLTNLLEAVLRVVCPTTKSSVLSPTSGEISIKSTDVCFPPTHSYTRTSVSLSVNLLD